jgi:hypothetical protein
MLWLLLLLLLLLPLQAVQSLVTCLLAGTTSRQL